jgi:type I restriction enzyme M protein
MLFVELCLRMLRPGGRLGIVLPRSVLTNDRLSEARKAVDTLGFLTHLVDLPQETFASTGTQTTTVAAFFERHRTGDAARSVAVKTTRLTNIGFDSTGRHRDGSQLPGLAARLHAGACATAPAVCIHEGIDARSTLQGAAKLLSSGSTSSESKATLGDFIDSATTGRTPARQAYTETGMFILKVGNLSGRGIDWEARERNFVSDTEAVRRKRNPLLTLRRGDVLLTSSAHASRYIAKKVDIVDQIPAELEATGITYVGELIMVRAKQNVDPFVLLAVLRHPTVRDRLQRLVRGQTAHLNPSDLLTVPCPFDLREPPTALRKAASTLRREADLAHELNTIAVDGARQISEARME